MSTSQDEAGRTGAGVAPEEGAPGLPRANGVRDAASATALTTRAPLFAELALANITREYPNAPAHLIAGPAELVPPRTYHPAFYGAYDWHSSVHMHWLLIRLLRLPPPSDADGTQRQWREAAIRVLDTHLTPEALAQEAAYLRVHPSFERPYGWAWLLALTNESTALSSEHPAAGQPPLHDESAALAPEHPSAAHPRSQTRAPLSPHRRGVGARRSRPPRRRSRSSCSAGCRRRRIPYGTERTPTARSRWVSSSTVPNARGRRGSWSP